MVTGVTGCVTCTILVHFGSVFLLALLVKPADILGLLAGGTVVGPAELLAALFSSGLLWTVPSEHCRKLCMGRCHASSSRALAHCNEYTWNWFLRAGKGTRGVCKVVWGP